MLHGRFMPSSAPKREGCAAVLGGRLLACVGCRTRSHAAEQPRIASINVCTDQLLLTLADPEQILGLSPYSRDPRAVVGCGEGQRNSQDCPARRRTCSC